MTPRFRPRNRPATSARTMPVPLPEGLQRYLAAGEAALAEPFRGNDYGMDLLRQHHERFDHRQGGHEAHAHPHRPDLAGSA